MFWYIKISNVRESELLLVAWNSILWAKAWMTRERAKKVEKQKYQDNVDRIEVENVPLV